MAEDYFLHAHDRRQAVERKFLSGLLDGTFNYYSAEHDSIEVTLNGDTAPMIGKSRVTGRGLRRQEKQLAAARRFYLAKRKRCMEIHRVQSIDLLRR